MKRINVFVLLCAFVLAMCTGAFAEDDLRTLLSKGEASVTLKANDSTSLSSNANLEISKDVVIDGGSKTVIGNSADGASGKYAGLVISGDSKKITIKNLALTKFGPTDKVGGRVFPIWTTVSFDKGTLNLENVSIDKFTHTAINANAGTIVIDGLKITGDYKSGDTTHFQTGISIISADVTLKNALISGVGSGLTKEDSDVAGAVVLTFGLPGNLNGTGKLTIESGTFEGEYGIIVADNTNGKNLGSVVIKGGTFSADVKNISLEGSLAPTTVRITGGLFSKAATDSADLKKMISGDIPLTESGDFWFVGTAAATESEDQVIVGTSETADVTKLSDDVKAAIFSAMGDLTADDFIKSEDVKVVTTENLKTTSPDVAKKLESSDVLIEVVSKDAGVKFTEGTVITFGVVSTKDSGRVLQKATIPSGKKFNLTKFIFYFIKLTAFNSTSAETVSLAAADDMVEAKLLDVKTGKELTSGELSGDFYAVPTSDLDAADYAMVAGEKTAESAPAPTPDGTYTTPTLSTDKLPTVSDDLKDFITGIEEGYTYGKFLGIFVADSTACKVAAEVEASTTRVYFVALPSVASVSVATVTYDYKKADLLNSSNATITTGKSSYAAASGLTSGTTYGVFTATKSGTSGSSGAGCEMGFGLWSLAALMAYATLSKRR